MRRRCGDGDDSERKSKIFSLRHSARVHGRQELPSRFLSPRQESRADAVVRPWQGPSPPVVCVWSLSALLHLPTVSVVSSFVQSSPVTTRGTNTSNRVSDFFPPNESPPSLHRKLALLQYVDPAMWLIVATKMGKVFDAKFVTNFGPMVKNVVGQAPFLPLSCSSSQLDDAQVKMRRRPLSLSFGLRQKINLCSPG